jgi:hypothetical protein
MKLFLHLIYKLFLDFRIVHNALRIELKEESIRKLLIEDLRSKNLVVKYLNLERND